MPWTTALACDDSDKTEEESEEHVEATGIVHHDHEWSMGLILVLSVLLSSKLSDSSRRRLNIFQVRTRSVAEGKIGSYIRL